MSSREMRDELGTKDNEDAEREMVIRVSFLPLAVAIAALALRASSRVGSSKA